MKDKAGDRVRQAKGSGMTERQSDALKRHASHHTPKHMQVMMSAMRSGKTFGEAHQIAMSKVGK